MRWNSTDNSMELEKSMLRIKYLPSDARVLDLFCGLGEMYHNSYENRAIEYHGIDRKKVHNNDICEISDNIRFVNKNDIRKFNVFDLDAYGSPWELLYLIMRKLNDGDYTVYVTDGLVMHQKVDGHVTKFVSGTERIPIGFNLPGINRFYVDIFATMLKDLENRYGCKTTEAVYFHNERRSVYYWALKITKKN